MSYPEWMIEGGDLVVGLGFALGAVLMNFPQHYLCWKHRSAEGLSLAYILICTISNVTLTLASLIGDFELITTAAANVTKSLTITTSSNSENLIIPLVSMSNATDTDVFLNDERQLSILDDLQNAAANDSPSMTLFVSLLKFVNVCMPTFQNFLSILVGVPSLILYYFWFSTPQRIPGRRRRTLSQTPLLPAFNNNNDNTTSITDSDCGTDSSTERSLTSRSSESLTELSFILNDDSMNTNGNNTRDNMMAIETKERYYYSDGTEARKGVIFTILTWCLVLVATLLSLGVARHGNTRLEASLLEIWGTIAAITNVVLYIPQIITLHRNQHEGVLSLVSYLVNVIGDVALGFFWMYANGESIWVYASLIADAGMQVVIIAMILDFRKKRRCALQQTYSFVSSNAAAADGCEEEYKGDIEIVYGEILEIYSSTTTAVEWLLEIPSNLLNVISPPNSDSRLEVDTTANNSSNRNNDALSTCYQRLDSDTSA